MQLDMCVLADHAEALNGKLYIHGGGVTRLHPPALPFPLATFVAIRLAVEEEDWGTPHSMDLVLTSPDGDELVRQSLEFGAERGAEPVEGEQEFWSFALGLNHAYSAKGVHRVTLTLDTADAASLALVVLPQSDQPIEEVLASQVSKSKAAAKPKAAPKSKPASNRAARRASQRSKR